MAEEQSSPKRKRPFLLNEMITQSKRTRLDVNAESDFLEVAKDATKIINKINGPLQPSPAPETNPLKNQSASREATVCPTVTATVSPTLSPTLSQSVSQSVPHSVPHSVSQSVSQSEQQSIQQSQPLTKQQSQPQSNDPFWSLTNRQASILTFLINNRSRITKHALISQATNISYLSVRDALYNLTRDGFLKRKVRFRRGNFQGFKYVLDEDKCEKFMRYQTEKATQNPSPQSEPQSGPQSVSPTLSPTLTTTGTISSSSFLKVPTTNNELHNLTKAIAETLENHPELGYWRQKGLTVKQIEQWMQLSGSTLNNMIQSLCHCRFEMVDLDQEKSKPVENVFNWFFRVIERVGYYPPPKGYKSYLHKQIELENQILAEREQQLKELRKIQEAKIAQEKELAFREMMSNPEGELYQTCYQQLNHFAQKSTRIELFEMAMRKAFDELMAKRDQEMLQAAENPEVH
ncbi:MAG: hypothetical protein PHW74_10870 [Desulfobacca sp.]|nr:hypothetical protein [Desulfobacca sp.]